MHSAEPAFRSLPLRIALASIVGFWAFYFVILTVRALILYQGHMWLGNRAIVSLASMGITFLFYLAMRRIPIERLRDSIVAAVLLAAPAAILYSTINWYVFAKADEAMAHKAASKTVIVTSAPAGASAPATTITVGQMPTEDNETALQSIADQGASGYFFFMCWAALYLALSYADKVRLLERRSAKLRAAAQAAELRALRYQVNPHFLFNTLNSLSSLVLGRKHEEAERMIMNLSTFFRTSLTEDPTEDVRLGDEIRLQRLYLDIESVRFPQRLVTVLDVPDALADACVPGLILQPLVENAVKYGVARARRPVTIHITARQAGGRLLLRVEDDGDGDGPAGPGTGTGLPNVRDRLMARFGHEAECRWGPLPNGGFAVELAMPLVRHAC